ncbi:GntR family transcriptional regulator [Aliidongia dinghuensis]|uniref:GntR family transcriptional regulator n=1 Tax=Aliidongia dinghuensis TaxID=1867774 RepID=A0A8J2YPL0_9PROT|nr:GntR family transcriptional regulator [Aliidongia dinghuensis]GGF01031.1 GntR family transcriptional regulator [Aliidongia dinghuensis]
MKSVVKQSAEAQAIAILREQLLTGVIAPGARLTEMDLAASLQIARATVRQALHHLAQEGLIVLIPYTGWMVVDLTPTDAWELYTLRAAIEALAARLAAENMTDLGQKRLKDAMAALTKAARSGSLPEAAEADFALHEAIVGLAQHRRLAEQYRIVSQQVRMFIASSDALVSGAALIDQHAPIVDAILAGDGVRAAQLSEQHNVSEGEKLVAHLKAHEAAIEHDGRPA